MSYVGENTLEGYRENLRNRLRQFNFANTVETKQTTAYQFVMDLLNYGKNAPVLFTEIRSLLKDFDITHLSEITKCDDSQHVTTRYLFNSPEACQNLPAEELAEVIITITPNQDFFDEVKSLLATHNMSLLSIALRSPLAALRFLRTEATKALLELEDQISLLFAHRDKTIELQSEDTPFPKAVEAHNDFDDLLTTIKEEQSDTLEQQEEKKERFNDFIENIDALSAIRLLASEATRQKLNQNQIGSLLETLEDARDKENIERNAKMLELKKILEFAANKGESSIKAAKRDGKDALLDNKKLCDMLIAYNKNEIEPQLLLDTTINLLVEQHKDNVLNITLSNLMKTPTFAQHLEPQADELLAELKTLVRENSGLYESWRKAPKADRGYELGWFTKIRHSGQTGEERLTNLRTSIESAKTLKTAQERLKEHLGGRFRYGNHSLDTYLEEGLQKGSNALQLFLGVRKHNLRNKEERRAMKEEIMAHGAKPTKSRRCCFG